MRRRAFFVALFVKQKGKDVGCDIGQKQCFLAVEFWCKKLQKPNAIQPFDSVGDLVGYDKVVLRQIGKAISAVRSEFCMVDNQHANFAFFERHAL